MAENAPRILVVDDELFFREAIRDILGGAGFDTLLVEDGEKAIECVEDASIGVAVLDIRLPGMDGIEVLGHLRRLRPDVRVIMLSAHTDQELVLEALRGGACDYLAKPLHDEELALAVERAAGAFRVEDRWTALRARLDRLAERLGELAGVVAASDATERESVLWEGAVEAAAEVLAARRASLLWLSDEGDELVVVASTGADLDPAEMDAVGVGERIAGIAFQAREPLVVEDIAADPRFAELANGSRYVTGSFAVAPLEAGSRCLGVLCVSDRHGDAPFGPEDGGLMRLLALQIAELAVAERGRDLLDIDTDDIGAEDLESASIDANENTALLVEGPIGAESAAPAEDAASSAAERDAELARLVCDAVVNEIEPQRLIEAALAPLAEGLPAAPVSLYLLEAGGRGLKLEGECDGGMRSDRPLLPPGRGLTGTVLETGQLIATSEPQGDGRFDAEVDAPADGVAGPLLCMPIRLRGRVVGLVRAFLEPGAEVSARSGEVLGAALSAAVRNVLLYRSLVESIDEVADARREARGGSPTPASG